jgi:hypothetical protein
MKSAWAQNIINLPAQANVGFHGLLNENTIEPKISTPAVLIYSHRCCFFLNAPLQTKRAFQSFLKLSAVLHRDNGKKVSKSTYISENRNISLSGGPVGFNFTRNTHVENL